ncbi:MAG: ABC transporter permease [Candidatus Bipolaricaulota bacterium]|nr:ABC transporter permease [Candidatus Bipolaricaulota bacterium]
MTGLGALFRTQARVFLRDRITLFFTVLFPIVFVLIFGFVWGGVEGPAARARLGLVHLDRGDDVLTEVLAAQQAVVVVPYADRAALEEDLAKKKVDLGLVWDGRSLVFLQDPTRVQEGYAFAELARGIAAEVDLQRQGLAPPVRAERENVGRTVAVGWFNLLVPGIMAFSILASGLLAVSGRITQMKERKLLDRLLVTPMSPGALLMAIAGVRLAAGFFATLTTLVAAVALFGVRFEVNWPLFVAFVVAATLGAMGLGTVIALVVRRPGSAGNVANISAQVMLLLSGVYFPLEIMPSFLRAVSRALPLTYMVEAMRYVTGVADMPAARFALVTGALFAVGAALFPVLGRYVVSAGQR